MSANATPADPTLSVTDARARIAEVVGRAEHGGQRTVLLRHGRPAAAVVPVADLERLRALDAAAALARALDDARAVTLATGLAADRATVWDTLVEPGSLRRWWPGATLVDEVGMPVAGVGPAEAEVAALEAPRLLVLRWFDPGDAAASTVRLELLADPADPGATTVVLTHRGLPDDAAAARHRAAWEERLGAWRALLGT